MCVYEAGMSICAQIHAGIARFPQKLAFAFSVFFSTSKWISRSKKRSIAKRVPPLESQENFEDF